MLAWGLALLYFYCEFSVDARSWGMELSLNLGPKSPFILSALMKQIPISSLDRTISRVYCHPDCSFSGFFSPLAFSQSIHKVCFQASVLPSPLCDMECLSTHPDRITVHAPKTCRPVFPPLTALSTLLYLLLPVGSPGSWWN